MQERESLQSKKENLEKAYLCLDQLFKELAMDEKEQKQGKHSNPLPSLDVDPQVVAAQAEEKALKAAMLSVFTAKRPLICFVCLGRKDLELAKRLYEFASPGDLTKHFKRKHLSQVKEKDRPDCNVCLMQLEHKMHFQNHALAIHGTERTRSKNVYSRRSPVEFSV